MPQSKRVFDVFVAFPLFVLLLPLLIIIALLIKVTSKGPVIYWSDRVGRSNRIFRMPKLRSMRINTPQLATHLLSDSAAYLTPIGSLLRRSSLDELPQLFSVLKGDLSLVGPRPALFNQADLIALRTEAGVHRLTPGITGLAQVNGRDDLEIPVKVSYDAKYMESMSLAMDLKILCLTIVKMLKVEGVHH